MMSAQKVDLIPWDPTNKEQYQRMHDQRVACGWRIEEVPEWKEKQLEGIKFLYWIVLSETLPNRSKLLQDHITKYPTESSPITDTATSVGSLPRIPSNNPFIPIGHTALELCPSLNTALSYPSSTIWIKSLYISWALQSAGIGRSAMLLTEQIAREAPHNATLLALDTMKGEYQVSEHHLKILYDDRGLERPEVIRSNEDWYLRQGWVLVDVKGRVDESYRWYFPSGGFQDMPVIYMTKNLVD